MFAKVFTQIFDSSLAVDYQVRIVFQDFLLLCDANGVVDMTPESISGRTGLPLEIVRKGIAKLEQPDPESRTPDFGGRRIIRLDDHRTWGWLIVNYAKYRATESPDQRREKTRERMRRLRLRRSGDASSVTEASPTVTERHCDAGDGKQKQRQMEKQKEEASTHVPPTRAREGELGLAAPENDVNRSPRAIPGSATAVVPTWDMALSWMKSTNEAGAAWVESEVRQAFVTLGERGWTRTTARGEVMTHDWKLSMEKQIGYGRERKESNANHGTRAAGGNTGKADKPLRSRHITTGDETNEIDKPGIRHYGTARVR